ncbi:hypothetical protein SLEP1_g35304 [Rubroshorea leprosula]|uniref:Uncharacterized protein n=1 Tax=Rubroshorea leprosula TaxID=152421 RepID=A0AAV5KMR2_9ROSI|nr:hypothetical protein SLEP1_g35304 [Rubroshorea leprosula]
MELGCWRVEEERVVARSGPSAAVGVAGVWTTCEEWSSSLNDPSRGGPARCSKQRGPAQCRAASRGVRHNAEQQAEGVRHNAEQQAEGVRHSAVQQAEGVRHSAEQQAEGVRHSAVQQAKEVRHSAASRGGPAQCSAASRGSPTQCRAASRGGLAQCSAASKGGPAQCSAASREESGTGADLQVAANSFDSSSRSRSVAAPT